MAKPRWNLQAIFEKILNSRNVYFQPPENIRMRYPAIRYSLTDKNVRYANDKRYMNTNCYQIMVISDDPDNTIADKLLDLPLCSFDRRYVADNLYHDLLTIYY